MHPILFKIGFLTIYSYGTMLAAAFLVVIFLISVKAEQKGISSDIVFSLGFRIIIWSVIGARLLYVLLNLREFSNPIEILFLNKGGLIFYGGLLGGIASAIVYLKKQNTRILDFFDLACPYLALGQAIARIGCFLNGCCYGKPAKVAGVIFSPDSIAGARFCNVPLHPVQVYDALCNLIIFIVLLKYGQKNNKTGILFFSYLLLYSAERFVFEFIRADSEPILLNLTFFQFMSVAIALFSLICIAIIKRHNENKRK